MAGCYFLLRKGYSIIGRDVHWLCGCFLGDACRQELMLIPATWDKTLHQFLGSRLMGTLSMQLSVGIVPGPFL